MCLVLMQGETYGNSVDIWTAGVLMYEFLVGRPPFVAPVSANCTSPLLLHD